MKTVAVGHDPFHLIENFCKWSFIETSTFSGCINTPVVRKNVAAYKTVESMSVIGKSPHSLVCIKSWLSHFLTLLLFLYISVFLESILLSIFVFNMWLEGDTELI